MAEKERPSSSNSGNTIAYALHFVVDAFGATRPIRLGLVLASALFLQLVVQSWAKSNGITIYVDDLRLSEGLFGLCFCLFFGPLLVWPGQLPEPVQERFTLIDTASKRAGFTRGERKILYLQFIEIVLSNDSKLAKINVAQILGAHAPILGQALSEHSSRMRD